MVYHTSVERPLSSYTSSQIQAALDELERGGVIAVSIDEASGLKRYQFPEYETLLRLVKERLDRPVKAAASALDSGIGIPLHPGRDCLPARRSIS